MAQIPDYSRYTERVKENTRGRIVRDERNQRESASLHRDEARSANKRWNKTRIGRREARREEAWHRKAGRDQDKIARNERRSLSGYPRSTSRLQKGRKRRANSRGKRSRSSGRRN